MIPFMCMVLVDEDNEEKFEQLYRKFEKEAYFIALKILKKRELAEEACSEAFLSIAKHFNSIAEFDPEKLDAYIIITVKNTSINIYNKEKDHAKTSNLNNDFSSLSDDVLSALSYNLILDCIKRLSDTDQEILYLRFSCGLSGREIADSLHISYDAARKRLQTARENLKKLLEREHIL